MRVNVSKTSIKRNNVKRSNVSNYVSQTPSKSKLYNIIESWIRGLFKSKRVRVCPKKAKNDAIVVKSMSRVSLQHQLCFVCFGCIDILCIGDK